jgi:peptidoglycan L-alanyl-D-glutamate endopeptidase CwlK
MDKITIERIKTFHPDYRDELLKHYNAANNLLGKGVRLRFAYVYRSIKEQDDLYAIGRTKKGAKVTNAKGGQSIHNYGLAFDIVLLYDKNGDGIFEEASWSLTRDGDNDKLADWMEVANYFKSVGYEWGGDWKNFKDAPHFQMKQKNGSSWTWQNLSNMKKIVDNGLSYPII